MKSGSERIADRRGGFTLVEVLLTLAIVSMLMASLMGVFMGSVRTKRHIENARSVFEVGPAILNLIDHDVQSVYFYDLDGEVVLSGRNHTVNGLDADRLEIVTSNDSQQLVEAGRTQRQSDFTRIAYALKSNPNASGFLMLYRRETALPDSGDRPGSAPRGLTLVYDRVKSFNIVYISGDPDEPEDGFADWDSATDGKLPAALRLDLEIEVQPKGGIGVEQAEPRSLKYSRLMLLPPGSNEDLSEIEPLAKNLDSLDEEGEEGGQQGGGQGQRNQGGRGRGQGGQQRRGNDSGDSGLDDLFGGN